MASPTSQPARPFDREKLMLKERNLYDTNTTGSALLRLPPEIRNRIYTLVLGERDIHIGQYIRMQAQKIPFHSVCEYGVRTRDLTNSIIKDGTEIGHENWAGVHHGCFYRFGAPYSFLELQLLGVCRQISQEASLIPFASNTFIFLDGPAMATLAGKWSAEQRSALANMCLNKSPASQELFPVPDKKAVEQFTGLKHLTILGWIPVRGLITEWAEALVRKTFEGTKEALQTVRWESAVVCLTSVSKFDMFEGQVLEDGHFRAESRELERALLKAHADGADAKNSDEGKVATEDSSGPGRVEGDVRGYGEEQGVVSEGKVVKKDDTAPGVIEEEIVSGAEGQGVVDGDGADGRMEEESEVSDTKNGEDSKEEDKARGESEGRETFRERRGLRKLKLKQ